MTPDGVGHVTEQSGRDSVSADRIKEALEDYGPMAVSYATSTDQDPATGVFDCEDCWRDNPVYDVEDDAGVVTTEVDTNEDCVSEGVCTGAAYVEGAADLGDRATFTGDLVAGM